MHSRRDFVQLLGASLALAGLDGCTRMPASDILPYVRQPELTPGVPRYFATSMVLDGFATGLLVESHDGRPTKIEGHPDHPASLGAAGALEQASVLQLYDPDRATKVRHGPESSTWDALASELAPDRLRGRLGARGAGLFLLLEPTSSPLEQALLDRIREMYPDARVHFSRAIGTANDALLPHYDFRAADVAVFADADVLAGGPFHLRYARHFADRRRPESAPGGMNRCYVLESSPSPTGAAADHRLAMRPGEILAALDRLAAYVGGKAPQPSAAGDPIASIARDLVDNRGRSLVIAGAHLPEQARVLARRINDALGNTGRTTWYSRSPLAGAGDPRSSFEAFVEALRGGAVDTLICAGGNPSYASAGVHDLGARIRRVRESVYLGLYENETARDCRWMAPSTHYLETWSDARAYDGTLSIVQPLLEPAAVRHTTSELLSILLGRPDVRAYQLLRESWQAGGWAGAASDFEGGWHHVLARGFVEPSAFPRETPPAAELAAGTFTPGPIEIVFRPHPRVHDGAFANNAWLQELPDAVTTLTWQNAAQISPVTAARLSIANGDSLDVRAAGRTLRIPAIVVTGHSDDCVTLHFGYGREGGERIARGAGTNVFPLWPGDTFVLSGAQLSRAASIARRSLPITQPHHSLETSRPARTMTVAEYERSRPASPSRRLTLYQPPVDLPDGPAPQQWAMTIDLGACIGCGACVVACQAENNIPVVGEEQVLRGREMHWLRIDWYAPADDAPALQRQPMLCQHCEKAPCEYVCPVEATVHSRDGLNEMIYNRCVGTRFCSNNCPYKVRRFNWFDFNRGLDAIRELVENPDVTVRERGVMEKCTFCVQRIREAEIASRTQGRTLGGDEVRTACQQTCPAQAITFGSLTDANSRVSRERSSGRAYSVLEDLGTEPRVRYLAAVRHPNPDLERRS